MDNEAKINKLKDLVFKSDNNTYHRAIAKNKKPYDAGYGKQINRAVLF